MKKYPRIFRRRAREDDPIWRVLLIGPYLNRPRKAMLSVRETAWGWRALCGQQLFWVYWNEAGDPYIDLACPVPPPPEEVPQ